MAETITIIENEYATLVYHPDTKIVHHTFLKPIAGDQFRAVLNAGVKILKEKQAYKWLSDNRANSVLPDEDANWAKTDWFPRAASYGWKYWAMVVPQNTAGRLNVKQFVDTFIDRGLRVMVFSSPEKAMDWLLTCDQIDRQDHGETGK